MKISNSKKELARIISENGGWRDGAGSSAQCSDGSISFWRDMATKRRGEEWCGSYLGRYNDIKSTGVKMPNWHQTILSRDEYFRLYPAPDADGWIEWNGGERPVSDDTLVEIKTRDGEIKIDQAYVWNWSHERGSSVKDRQIIAYRLHKPEKAKPEFCESVIRSIPEPSNKPTIEKLAADYRNLLYFAQRKQEEADDAKADADEALRRMELAGEEIGLIVTPITAKQESELVITDWRDLIEGDVVFVDGMTCAENEFSVAMIGRECTVVSDGDMYPVCLMNEFTPPGESYWLGGGCNEISWRFIRRP